mgnify:CR=1 FL=1
MRWVTVPLVWAWLLFPALGYGHALHPDSIDRHAQFTFTPSEMVLVYQLVLGINPTEEATRQLDPDDDGEISEADRDRFVRSQAAYYAQGQRILIDGQPIAPAFEMGDAYATVGHHGIHVIKIDLGYRAALPASIPRGASLTFSYEDTRLLSIPGWKQVNLEGLGGVRFDGHIPYREFRPFDYQIIAEYGFYPATDDFDGTLFFPQETQSLRASLTMPERVNLETPRPNSLLESIFLVAGSLFVVLCLATIYAKWQQWI